MTTRPGAYALAVAALVATAVLLAIADDGPDLAGVGSGDTPDAVAAARQLLAGRAFTTHGSGSVTSATVDRTLHLCADGRFTLESTFVSTTTETLDEQRATGTWEVADAQGEAGAVDAATLRYTLDGGGTGTVAVRREGDGATFDGQVAEAAASARC